MNVTQETIAILNRAIATLDELLTRDEEIKAEVDQIMSKWAAK